MPTALATLLSGVVGASAAAIFGLLKSQKTERRNEGQRQADVAAYIDGIPAVPGVTDGAPSAALRTQRLERSVTEVVQGQALLEKRMDEANGTGKRTEQMVRAIQEHLGLVTP